MLELMVLFGLVCAVTGAELGRGATMAATLVRCAVIVIVLIGGLSLFRIWVRFLPFILVAAAIGYFWLKSNYASRGARRDVSSLI